MTTAINEDKAYSERRQLAASVLNAMFDKGKDFAFQGRSGCRLRLLPCALMSVGAEAFVYAGALIEENESTGIVERVRIGVLRYKRSNDASYDALTQMQRFLSPNIYRTWNELYCSIMMTADVKASPSPRILAARNLAMVGSGCIATFSEFVSDAVAGSSNGTLLPFSAEKHKDIVHAMRRAGLAHRDLHHNNVMINISGADVNNKSSEYQPKHNDARLAVIDYGISAPLVESRHWAHLLALSSSANRAVEFSLSNKGVVGDKNLPDSVATMLLLGMWPDMIDTARISMTRAFMIAHRLTIIQGKEPSGLELPGILFNDSNRAALRYVMQANIRDRMLTMRVFFDLLVRNLQPYTITTNTRMSMHYLYNLAKLECAKSGASCLTQFVYGSDRPANTVVSIEELVTRRGCELDMYGQLLLSETIMCNPTIQPLFLFDADAKLVFLDPRTDKRAFKDAQTAAKVSTSLHQQIRACMSMGLHHAAADLVFWSCIVPMIRKAKKQTLDRNALLTTEQMGCLFSMINAVPTERELATSTSSLPVAIGDGVCVDKNVKEAIPQALAFLTDATNEGAKQYRTIPTEGATQQQQAEAALRAQAIVKFHENCTHLFFGS
jgi:hypothetical protein